jgi:acetyl-CoA carboxylase carboxyl transferase subunit beta
MHFDKPTYSVRKTTKKKGIPEGLYTKDPVTGEILFNKEIEDNQMVVPKSGHHFPIGARQRLESSSTRGHSSSSHGRPLRRSPEVRRLAAVFRADQALPARERLPEAVVCGTGAIHGIPVSIAVMDFRFCGGSMGSAAGEKITRTIEDALTEEDSLHHLQRLRRGAHAGGHLLADADGEDERGAWQAGPGGPAVTSPS